MKIGELSKISGLPAETIRFYEKEKLLPDPPRSDSNYRQYGDTHAKRLQFIKHCRLVGLSLDEIRTLIRINETPVTHQALQAHQIVKEHIESIDRKMEELKKMKEALLELASKCPLKNIHDPDQCE
ncbi:MAG: heavy metal-responsive transcriptional regulator, partial [Burkholderiales bacterium]|nr:heavy metal-responsive transcriptional regulator [Burkholderiales bacterium]